MPQKIQSEPLVRSLVEGLNVDYVSRTIRPSLGVREAGSSSRGVTGRTLEPTTYRKSGFDSDIEHKVRNQLLQRTDVAHIQEQALRSSWVDAEGVLHHTTWDFKVTLTNGEVELVSVKTLEDVAKPGFEDKLRRQYAGIEPGVATSAYLMTEHSLDPASVSRGAMYGRALREPPPREAQRALDFIAARSEPVTIKIVCEFLRGTGTKLKGTAHLDALSNEFWTVVWLLAKRLVRLASEGRLNTMSKVAAA